MKLSAPLNSKRHVYSISSASLRISGVKGGKGPADLAISAERWSSAREPDPPRITFTSRTLPSEEMTTLRKSAPWSFLPFCVGMWLVPWASMRWRIESM